MTVRSRPWGRTAVMVLLCGGLAFNLAAASIAAIAIGTFVTVSQVSAAERGESGSPDRAVTIAKTIFLTFSACCFSFALTMWEQSTSKSVVT